MLLCSKDEYRDFVDHFPNLCLHGLTSKDHCRLFKLDLAESRRQLARSYVDFVDCCKWLQQCRMDDYATHYSPTSEQVRQRLSNALDREIAHGVIVTAVLFLDLPHVTHGTSPGLSIGISRFCAHYLRSSPQTKQIQVAQ
jgi:hypothetical protein